MKEKPKRRKKPLNNSVQNGYSGKKSASATAMFAAAPSQRDLWDRKRFFHEYSVETAI